MAGFGNIGPGLAAMYPGMVEGRRNEAQAAMQELQLQNAQADQQADTLRGNALMNLFASSRPGGGPQPPMPGQSSVPAQPPQAGPPGPVPGAGLPFPPQAGPRPSPAPPGPTGASAPLPVTDAAPQGRQEGGAQPPRGVNGADAMAGTEAPLNGVGEQGGRPTFFGGVPNGPLTWQTIGSAIARANPGADPRLIAKAIDRFAPMMTQESQMQWHILKMQQDERLLKLREAGKDTRSQRREENLNERASFMRDLRREEDTSKNQRNTVSNETRMATAGLSAETRMLISQAHEEGANGRLMTQLRARDDWKKLDVESKRELTDLIIAGQNERAAASEEGRNRRSDNTIAGANQRNENTIVGANQRSAERNVTSLDIARQRNEMQKWLADGKPITATQKALSEKGQAYSSAINTIDDAMNSVAKGHREGADVVGLKGRVRGLAETAGNLAGWSDATSRAAFVQQIEILRTQLPKLLTGSAISNKDERARLNNILQGLERGSTKQATFADLVYLKQKLQELAPQLKSNMNQGDVRRSRNAPAASEPAGAPADLKPMTPAIKAGMDKAIADGRPRAEVEKFIRDTYGVDPAGALAEEPAAPARNRYGGQN